MHAENQDLDHLLQLYAAGQASDEQVRDMLHILRKLKEDDASRVLMTAWQSQSDTPQTLPDTNWESIWDEIASRTDARRNTRRLAPIRKLAAAAVLLACVIAAWLYLGKKHYAPLASTSAANRIPQLAPGGNKATLTLSNGQKIVLDTAANGLIAQQGNASIQKLAAGQLTYKNSSHNPQNPYNPLNPGLFNTLTTPRGGQFQIVLPDGTHAWLNSASSLRYPTVFKGGERKVELQGEAYFEVARDPSRPFRVETNNLEIDVLGTAFDIMAYSDEPALQTTLLEGAVKVSSGDNSVILRPGEQASLPAAASRFTLSNPDLDEVLAWKDGKFKFKKAGVPAIMRQIARWYDVDIQYNGDLSGIELSGGMSRKQYASQLLELLEQTGRIHFETRGRIITVQPAKK